MATTVGVAFSDKSDALEAGVSIAQSALQNGNMSSCDLALVFNTPKLDSMEFMKGVREILGESTQIVGGSAVGIITNDSLGYAGYQSGIMVISSDTTTFRTFLTGDVDKGDHEAGERIGEMLRSEYGTNVPSTLLFYDSVKRTSKMGAPEMNLATPILEGIFSKISDCGEFAGCGMLADAYFEFPSDQYCDGKIVAQSIIALCLKGDLQMDTSIIHGTKPASGYHTITKVVGNVVMEIDNKPALQVIDTLLGSEISWEEFPLLITLGVNHGDRFDYKEEDYASRLCLAIDKEHKALVMFEPDLKEGMEVQLMRRSIDFSYIEKQSNELLKKIEGRKPVFALYIDCLGRCAAYCGMDKEEAEEIQLWIGSKIPLLGIYSGVEIARVGKNVKPLDWTGVLCVFSEPER